MQRLTFRAGSLTAGNIKPFRSVNWQRPQQHGVNETEGRSASANRQSQRKHRSSRSYSVAPELTPAENQVGTQPVETGNNFYVTAVFPMPQSRAKRFSGFFGIAALLDGFGDMGLELFVNFTVQALAAKYIADARP